MTITVRKLHLAIAVLAVALIAPATALATHIFDDVEHDRFYADAVEWAAAEGITTGVSPTRFAPEENVTRGEAVTFLKRYDDYIKGQTVPFLNVRTKQRTADLRDGGRYAETVTCNTFETLVGGGYAHDEAGSTPRIRVAGNHPVGNKWSVSGSSDPQASPLPLTVYALCVPFDGST